MSEHTSDENKKILENWADSLENYEIPTWEELPSLSLYMDQVITLITRMYEPLYGDATCGYLSASMINNYVKAKLIPRPTGKKYGREQIALLTMIVSLKQVATMEDIRAMLTPAEDQTVEDLYALFCAQQQAVIAQIASANEKPGDALPTALHYAILSSAYRAGCETVLRDNA